MFYLLQPPYDFHSLHNEGNMPVDKIFRVGFTQETNARRHEKSMTRSRSQAPLRWPRGRGGLLSGAILALDGPRPQLQPAQRVP